MKRLDVSDVFVFLGLGLMSAGCWLFHPGAGLIVLGLGLFWIGLYPLLVRRKG